MRFLGRVSRLIVIICALVALPTAAQIVALSGAFYAQAPNLTTDPGIPLRGYEAYLYGPTGETWVGPSITDESGSFAFYDLPPGKYLLRLYSSSPWWKYSIAGASGPLSV
jgi:hypothetical protein